jgi:hypothetical protein
MQECLIGWLLPVTWWLTLLLVCSRVLVDRNHRFQRLFWDNPSIFNPTDGYWVFFKMQSSCSNTWMPHACLNRGLWMLSPVLDDCLIAMWGSHLLPWNEPQLSGPPSKLMSIISVSAEHIVFHMRIWACKGWYTRVKWPSLYSSESSRDVMPDG